MSCLLQCCIDSILKRKSNILFGLKVRMEWLEFWQWTPLLLHCPFTSGRSPDFSRLPGRLALRPNSDTGATDTPAGRQREANNLFHTFCFQTFLCHYWKTVAILWVAGSLGGWPQSAFWGADWLTLLLLFCHSNFSRKQMRCRVQVQKIFTCLFLIHDCSLLQ